MKITLRKALQLKNKFAGDLLKINTLISQNNSKKEGSVNRFDVVKLLDEKSKLMAKLIEIKTAIAKANIGIYDKITKIAELKADITFFNSLDCFEGEKEAGYGVASKSHVYTSTINPALKTELISSYEKEIEKYQDEVDYYNHTTQIEISD